ncbi:MAG: DUF1080 domain-containing protein [Planctomycetaceae bacterium]|jgi:hypothetical protein|nr:DUF1080 domain-containing protein [Planctomycetaceae bacterium]
MRVLLVPNFIIKEFAMKTRFLPVSLCWLFVLAVSAAGQTLLFEKTNLNEWAFHTDKEGVQAADIYSFADGVLKCKGEPFGWLGTKENYKNFKLEVEYRWAEGAKPTNSGIFIRLCGQNEDTFLPKTIEVQLGHKNAGDLWGFHGFTLPAPKGADDRFSEKDGNEKLGKMMGVKKLQDREKEPGQWNAVEVLAVNGFVVVSVNGKIVNWVTDAEQVEGKIGFQSEGGPIEFRNAVLDVLP